MPLASLWRAAFDEESTARSLWLGITGERATQDGPDALSRQLVRTFGRRRICKTTSAIFSQVAGRRTHPIERVHLTSSVGSAERYVRFCVRLCDWLWLYWLYDWKILLPVLLMILLPIGVPIAGSITLSIALSVALSVALSIAGLLWLAYWFAYWYVCWFYCSQALNTIQSSTLDRAECSLRRQGLIISERLV